MTSRLLSVRFFLPILFIGLLLSSAALAGKKKPPAQPVNLNTATSEELQQVPGIGPVTASKILQMRKTYGAFKSVDDLLAIRGLGPKRLDKMRKYLTVGKAGAQRAAPAKACSGCAKPKTPPTNAAPKPTPPSSTDLPDSEPTEPPQYKP
jgi:competence ComEA-like helix-hairpin-helix protein